MGIIGNTFRWFTTTSSERAYLDECKDRQHLSDSEFYQHFYADSEISIETCVGVRRVLSVQLGMCNTRPSDNVGSVFDDLDISEICIEIGEEFGVTFPDELLEKLDGTVDSLIRGTEYLTGGGHPTPNAR